MTTKRTLTARRRLSCCQRHRMYRRQRERERAHKWTHTSISIQSHSIAHSSSTTITSTLSTRPSHFPTQRPSRMPPLPFDHLLLSHTRRHKAISSMPQLIQRNPNQRLPPHPSRKHQHVSVVTHCTLSLSHIAYQLRHQVTLTAQSHTIDK